jgi:hypothetical protein
VRAAAARARALGAPPGQHCRGGGARAADRGARRAGKLGAEGAPPATVALAVAVGLVAVVVAGAAAAVALLWAAALVLGRRGLLRPALRGAALLRRARLVRAARADAALSAALARRRRRRRRGAAPADTAASRGGLLLRLHRRRRRRRVGALAALGERARLAAVARARWARGGLGRGALVAREDARKVQPLRGGAPAAEVLGELGPSGGRERLERGVHVHEPDLAFCWRG